MTPIDNWCKGGDQAGKPALRNRYPKLLVSISAPHFCAGIIVQRDKVIEAAPILGWTLGKSYSYLLRYFRRKGWEVHEVS